MIRDFILWLFRVKPDVEIRYRECSGIHLVGTAPDIRKLKEDAWKNPGKPLMVSYNSHFMFHVHQHLKQPIPLLYVRLEGEDTVTGLYFDPAVNAVGVKDFKYDGFGEFKEVKNG